MMYLSIYFICMLCYIHTWLNTLFSERVISACVIWTPQNKIFAFFLTPPVSLLSWINEFFFLHTANVHHHNMISFIRIDMHNNFTYVPIICMHKFMWLWIKCFSYFWNVLEFHMDFIAFSLWFFNLHITHELPQYCRYFLLGFQNFY